MTRHSGTGPRGPWVLSPSLVAMEAEADRMAPNRRRVSDGSIGDAAHAARESDHNPDEAGAVDYVDGLDLTHDPVAGFDAHAQARSVARNIANGVESRIDYIISNWQIFSQRLGVWAWRPYTGSHGHTQHAHFSVRDSGRFATSPWFSTVIPFPATHTPPPYVPPPTPGPLPKYPVKEGEMYLRNNQTGEIWSIGMNDYRLLSGPDWELRQREGATYANVDPLIIMTVAGTRVRL